MLLLLIGCSTESAERPNIESLDQNIHQLQFFELRGSGFGEYTQGHSALYVSGWCADIEAWEDDYIRAQLPSGLGLGSKTLTLQTSYHALAHQQLWVLGQDLPEKDRRCTQFTPSLLDDLTSEELLDEEDGQELWDAHLDLPETDIIESAVGAQFIAVRDISGNDVGRNPGVDLDAVMLYRPSTGQTYFASSVFAFSSYPLEGQNNNPMDALGSPDAYSEWPELDTCLVWEASICLGGGGFIVLQLPVVVEAGDIIDIYEVGACEFAPEVFAIPEDYAVYASADPNGERWRYLGAGRGVTSIEAQP